VSVLTLTVSTDYRHLSGAVLGDVTLLVTPVTEEVLGLNPNHRFGFSGLRLQRREFLCGGDLLFLFLGCFLFHFLVRVVHLGGLAAPGGVTQVPAVKALGTGQAGTRSEGVTLERQIL
jgi:hypothetical protein